MVEIARLETGNFMAGLAAFVQGHSCTDFMLCPSLNIKLYGGLVTRIKLTALALLCAATLSACGGAVPTLPKIIAENNWRGKNIEAAVSRFGDPASIAQAPDGRTVYNWYDGWSRNVDVPLGSVVHRGTVYLPYETRRQDYNCHVRALVRNGMIEELSFNYNRIGGCSAFGI